MSTETNTTSGAADEPAVQLKPGLLRAFQGVWTFEWQSRMTFGKLGSAAAAVLGLPILMLITMPQGSVDTFHSWAVTFFLLLVLPLNCLSFFGPMIRDDVQSDTLPFVITRPLKRHTLYLLKYFCVMLWAQLVTLAGGLMFVLVAMLKGIEGIVDLIPYYFLAQFAAVIAFGALSGLLGLLSKKYMVLGVVYGTVIEVGIGSIPTNIHSLAISYHIKSILANSTPIAKQYGWTAASAGEAVGIALIVTAVFLVLGALLFSAREFHHADEMQK